MSIKAVENILNTFPNETERIIPIQFAAGNKLLVDKMNNQIKVFGNDNQLQIEITFSEKGLVVNLNANELNINAEEQISLFSKKINISALEQINIKTNGNLVQQVSKDALNEVGGANKLIAQTHKITATLGGVDIKANDDVRLDGESVKLNCT